MYKKIVVLILCLTLGVVGYASAQSGRIIGVVTDAATQEGIPGAVIEITPKRQPDRKRHDTSGYGGAVRIDGVAYGDYTVAVTFIGYGRLEREVKVDRAVVDLGKLLLKEESTQIETVVMEAKIRTSQKGDTVSYLAGAFKVSTDSDVEGLLKKMPGIIVNNGSVEAQGETIQKIFVDGKEFFGEDVTSAIKSLPAEAVNRIEVFNKLSDQAEFSGVDDGEGYKALNIVTHEHMRQGQFGQLYAGYGYDADTKTEARNKYMAGGNVNIFHKNHRLSLLGLFNNINQQNFSFEDILGVTGGGGGGGGFGGRGVGQYMVRPQSGIATVNAIGLNYSGTWGKREQWSLQGSYFFNNTRTVNRSRLERIYESPAPLDTLITEGYSDTRNMNNRLNARLEWKISENQSLMIRPSVSFQLNDPFSTTLGHQYGESGYNVIDNFSDAYRNGYRVSTSALYRARLGKPGRTLTLEGYFNYYDSQRDQNSHSNEAAPYLPYPNIDPETGEELRPGDTELTDYLFQRIIDPSRSYRLNGTVSYTEPLSATSQLTANYRVAYNYQENDRKAYRTNEDYEAIGAPDPQLSNGYSSGYLTHSVGPGYNYSKNRSTLSANIYYEHSTLSGEVLTGDAERIRNTFQNVTYFLQGRLFLNSSNSLRLFVRSNTRNPRITQLQSVYDLSDAQYISRGNPDLRPSYNHNLHFHYNHSNVEKGRTFMWMFGASASQNYITTATEFRPTIDIDGVTYRPLQYSSPVNMDGYWNLRSHLSYGFPLNFMKCNLNVMGGVNWSLTPSMIDGVRNNTSNIGYDARVVLGSNISENIDFTLSWNGTYNEATNSASTGGKNRYFNHSATATFKFVFGPGFSITGSASYVQYLGFTNNYNDDYLLCNVFVGKKLFRNRRGEISIGVNDVFNQNKAFVRTTGSGYSQNEWNSIIGRYYCVQFVYNLRNFGKRGSKELRDYGVQERSSSSVGMSRGSSGGFRGGPPMRR